MSAMLATSWQIQQHSVVLRSVGLAGQFSLSQSTDGLNQVIAGGKLWHAARLLGLARVSPTGTEPSTSLDQDAILDSYVRGNDLILTYETPAVGNSNPATGQPLAGQPLAGQPLAGQPLAGQPLAAQPLAGHSSPGPKSPAMRIDATWRAITPEVGDKFIAAVDLVVSIQTTQFNIPSDLIVQSSLPAMEALQLTAREPLQYQPMANTETIVLQPESGVGCLLFRQAGLNVSYVEMIHPSDFRRDELLHNGLAKNELCLIHHLFPTTLEKGVVLQARLRGMFIPRIDDIRICAECYASFAAAEPPLGA